MKVFVKTLVLNSIKPLFSHAIKSRGLKYLFRWPAIICKDPDLCESSIQSVDGDTLSYHVEFLGKKHCHSFVRAPLVTTYVKNAQLCELSPKLASDFKTKVRASKVKK